MIRLAIIGTGSMAQQHADRLREIAGVRLAACCDVDPARAQAFAQHNNIPQAYTDAAALLDAGGLDAVSIVASDAAHKDLAVRAARHGLHILCEKPLATNAAEAKVMLQAVRAAKVVNMVNFSYRASAALYKAHELVAAGALGELRHVEASYLQGWLTRAVWRTKQPISPGALWRMSAAQSKGDLGDLGVHILDFMTFVAGPPCAIACQLASLPKGLPGNKYKGVLLDANDSFVASLRFANGALGVVHSSRWATGQNNSLRLRMYGTAGGLVVDLDRAWNTLQLCCGKDVPAGRWRTLRCPKVPSIYQRFIRSMRTGTPGRPDFEDGWRIQCYLDACLTAAARGRAVRVSGGHKSTPGLTVPRGHGARRG